MTPPYVLVALPKPRAIEVEPGQPAELIASGIFRELTVWGPASLATCQAAANNIDQERFMFAVLPLHEAQEQKEQRPSE